MSNGLPLLQQLKALIDADIAINSIPSPNFSFSEWQEISRALADQAQPVAWVAKHWSVFNTGAEVASGLSLDEAMDYLTDERAARGWSVVCVINKDNMAEPAPPAPQPLTIERLRAALVASRVIPPEAVEDADNYDDGAMLGRIEALHRRIA